MNSLSWFLYFADVLTGVSIFFILLGGLGFACGIIGLIVSTEYEKANVPSFLKCIAASIFVVLLSVFIPSKSTMYAIAASELGQQAAQSELGTNGLKAIEAWIDSQINPKK